MRFRWTWMGGWALALALGLFVVSWAASDGSPRRMWVGIVAGPEALAYLPPRREIEVPPGPPQPTQSLAEAGVDPDSVEVAMRYAEDRNSQALVIGVNGHVVYQKYWGDTTLESWMEASGFAEVLPALVLGTSIQNGELRNLDEPLEHHLKAWAGDPRGTITWRDLLTGNSGLATPEARPWPGTLAARFYVQEDLGASLIAWPQAERRESASPTSVDAEIVSLALQSRFAAPWSQLLRERIWEPLGAGPFSLGTSGASGSVVRERAACCLRARIADWMRIGALIANRGVFEGSQLLPPDYVRLMLTPTHNGSPRSVFLHLDGQFAARDVVRLEAEGKQRLWMVPSLKLVILRMGGEPSSARGWDEAMIPDTIIRGTRGWEPAGASPDGKIDPSRYAPH